MQQKKRSRKAGELCERMIHKGKPPWKWEDYLPAAALAALLSNLPAFFESSTRVGNPNQEILGRPLSRSALECEIEMVMIEQIIK